jgi:hypothetical protein
MPNGCNKYTMTTQNVNINLDSLTKIQSVVEEWPRKGTKSTEQKKRRKRHYGFIPSVALVPFAASLGLSSMVPASVAVIGAVEADYNTTAPRL